MLDVSRFGLSTLLICVLDDELCDTSGPLFSLYSKMKEKRDDRKAERYQKDAEGIVLFVSFHSCLHTPKHIN
jgi:hypothetical protein